MFLTTQGIVMYKNKLWRQFEGVTTVCPLGNFSKLFPGCAEGKLFGNKNDLSPSVYLRHIDDIYCASDTVVWNFHKC